MTSARPSGFRVFPAVAAQWVELVNAEGIGATPFRQTNALDVALCGISTWHGKPEVAAARFPEYSEAGEPSLAGERRGMLRAEDWVGHRFEHLGVGPAAFDRIAEKLRAGGHGSAAVIVNTWPGGSSHAWNALNQQDSVLWADFQSAEVGDEPLYDEVEDVWAIVLDQRGSRL